MQEDVLQKQVSLYSKINQTDQSKTIVLGEALDRIKDGYYMAEIERLRNTKDILVRKNLKNSLPYFTGSGRFKERKDSGLISHSGVLILDFDKLDDVHETKAIIVEDPHVMFAFISCGGSGLAVGVNIDGDRHREAFTFLSRYFKDNYSLTVDAQCVDVSRARFISYDPDIFINPKAVPVSLPDAPTDQLAQDTAATQTPPVDPILDSLPNAPLSDERKYDLCRVIIDKRITYQSGHHHEYLKSLSSFLNSAGVQYSYALTRITSELTISTQTPHEIKRIVDHYYTKQKDKFGTYLLRDFKKDARKKSPLPDQIKKLMSDASDVKAVSPAEETGMSVEKIKAAVQDLSSGNSVTEIFRVEEFLDVYYQFRRNIITQKKESSNDGGKTYQRVNVNSFHRALKHMGITYSLTDLKSLLDSDYIIDYDPFRHYFENLPAWDGVDHIEKLAGLVKAEDQTFFNTMFKKTLVRCIPCAIDHQENRMVFVLVSKEQEIGKSRLINFLNPFGQDYYTESPLSAGKDTEFRFSENFIYNIEELSVLNNKDVNELKAIISKRLVKERKPYAVDEEAHPRRCNFFGSTNKLEFLTDTLNKRWLCFMIHDIDWKGYVKAINIQDVWAQAYHLYKSGFDYQLTSEEQQHREETNKMYEVRTTESDLVARYFISCKPTDEGALWLSNPEIISHIDKESDGRFSRLLNMYVIGRAMIQNEFEQERKRMNGKMVRGYWLKFANASRQEGNNYDQAAPKNDLNDEDFLNML